MKSTVARSESKKKKRSGATFRKLRDAKAQKLLTAQLGHVIKLPNLRRLRTVNDWLTQLGWIYRRAVAGELPAAIASRLTYIANTAAQVAKELEQARQIESLQRQLAAMQSGQPLPAPELLRRDDDEPDDQDNGPPFDMDARFTESLIDGEPNETD